MERKGGPLRDLANQVAEREPAAEPAAAAASRDHRVQLDAGRVTGGRRRDLTLAVATGGAGFDYRARLIARRYGAAQDEGVEVGGLVGTADGAAEVNLCFPAVDLPPQLQRLVVELDVRLAEPGRAPALHVVDRS
jgi:hypothetical protein